MKLASNVKEVLEMLSESGCPDRVTLVLGKTMSLDEQKLRCPDQLVIDVVNSIRALGKSSPTELFLSAPDSENKTTYLRIPIPAKRP